MYHIHFVFTTSVALTHFPTEILLNELKMPLDVHDNRGLTPFHYTLTKPGCLHLARCLLSEKPELINQKVN